MTMGLSLSKVADSRWMSASGTWRAAGMWPAPNSTSVRTSTVWPPDSMICFASAAVTSGMTFKLLNVELHRWPIQVSTYRVDAVTVNARLLNVVGDRKAEVPFDLDTALAETVSHGASDLHVKPGCRPRV